MMKKMLNAIIFFNLFLFFNTAVFSQTINLEQARTIGLANSRSLARYEMAIRTSLLEEKNQFFSMLPQVSAGYNASMNFIKNWNFVNPIDTFSAGANLSITQIIFQGGKSFIQKAISNISTESVRIEARSEFFNVLDSIDNAYYAVLEAEATLEAETSSLQAAVLGLSIAEVRQMSGMINQGDYLKALADKEARDNSHNQARRNLTMNMNRFKTLLGITGNVELLHISFEEYEEVIQHLSSISDEDSGALYEEFWKILAADNPSLARAVMNNKRAELNYTLSRRDYAPTISATIFGTGLGFTTEKGFSSTAESGISIRGSIPVDFWVMNNRIERSKISLDSAAIDFQNAESSLEQELQNALFNLFSQAGSVISSRRSLEYTERHFNYVMERYRLGQSSVSDLNEATTLFINSRNSSTRASFSFLQSLSKLRSMCAMDDEEKLLSILVK
ncbi:MAG: TolC family protein [Treponema sp.]|nr:TolC family protein [Treponema sp.]